MTLAAKLMLRQQEQTVSGRFGSWHQDGARRCEDLYVRVVEPELAAKDARIAELEAGLAAIIAERDDDMDPHDRVLFLDPHIDAARALLHTERTA